MYRVFKYLILMAMAWMATACSTTRHLKEGEYLLRRSTIEVEGEGEDVPSGSDLTNYLRQRPNSRALGFLPLRLYTYNWSGTDTTKRVNRWLRNLGEPPAV